jgi:hypothetical protein
MPQIPALFVELLDAEDDDEDEEVPDLYIPGLIAPTMFLQMFVPQIYILYQLLILFQTDPLTTLLTKIRTSRTKTFPRFVWTMASR